MQTDSQHIIHKLTLEVSTSSVQQGYEIKDNMRSFIDTHVVPAIERYFAGLTGYLSADEVVQLDKLELTVNSGQNGWNISGLGQEIQLEFDKAISVTRSGLADFSSNKKATTNESDSHFGNAALLNDAPKIENLKVSAKSKHGVLAWISFLNDGTTDWFTHEMPNSGSVAQEEQLLKSIVQEVDTVNKKRQFVFGSSQARNRLIGQFSDSFLISLVTALNRNAASMNYSSVLPKQQQSITAFISELLRGTDTQTRTRFWETVFNITGLIENQIVLSEETFLALMEKLFPKATNLVKSGKSSHKNPDLEKSTGKKVEKTNVDGVSNVSAAKFSLIPDDLSLIGIRLLEWMHVLQSKPISLKKYIALQTSVLKNRQISVDSLNSNPQNTSKSVSPSGLVKPPKKDVSQESQTKKHETDLKAQSLEGSNELSSFEKEQQELLDKKTAAPDAEKITEEAAVNGGNQDQNADFQESDTSVQSKKAADSALKSVEEKIDLIHPESLPQTSKPANSDKAGEDLIQPKKKLFKDEQTHLLVENAGLVILHPFLKHFFIGIDLLNEENKITDKVLAAHVLHYVATGREHDFEQVMSFEKYLVGIDPFESIPREITISDAIKLEAENMLKAVRENWKPLQSSSSAALRETFIQRHGKLINEKPNPRLVVERKMVDVLMSQLNWTISIIRLPWLDELIFVEW